MNAPEVSVVMAVHDGGDRLEDTLDSILQQRGVDLELVVVDDGSTDSSLSVLKKIAGLDGRVNVMARAHQGLTRALIEGCRAARAPFIARHDARDRSDPDRLCTQLDILRKSPHVSLVSSWVEYEGPRGQKLGQLRSAAGILAKPDPHAGSPDTRFPFHGSTMFRLADYRSVGGYRQEFYFAQDIDLWLRLSELGEHYMVPRLLYIAGMDEHSISGLYRDEQDALRSLAMAAASARRQGAGEERLLLEAGRVKPDLSGAHRRTRRSRSLYFLGCMLAQQGHSGARDYFLRSIRNDPLHWRSWCRLLYTSLRPGNVQRHT